MRKMIIVSALFALAGCGNSYDKSPEDRSNEICDCAAEKGGAECQDLVNELKNYYSDDDYGMHDEAIHQVTLNCPEAMVY